MSEKVDYQTRPGRTTFCCKELAWAFALGYIKRGYLYRKHNPPRWIPWRFDMSGNGWVETGPIHFCPFCGTCLDVKED